jgi:Na+(H+)/acetate symporter ActP
VVGTSFANLPAWVAAWAKIDPTLMSITDINKDGIVQLAEMTIGGDIIVLATPEIAGLPYVISGLVAAGGLAAALSTADGLLLTIANALSHDLYYKMINPNATTQKRVLVSKILLLVVAHPSRRGSRRRSRGTSCSWSARRSRWRPRPSSRRSCWACSGSAPTSGAPSPA